ncbi:MAG: phosphotransferase, partial [Allorhizobium sp.]
MADSALLQRTELPRPNVSLADAKIIFNDFYGFSGEIRELGSQQDRNFLIDTGNERLVLKVTRGDYPQHELDAQNRAMDHLRNLDIGLRIPEPIPALTGEYIPQIELGEEYYWIRLLSYLDGQPLTRQKYLAPDVVAAFGDIVARVATGLKDFRHAGLERDLQWDLRRAGPVALHLLKSVTDQKQRDRIAKAMIMAVKRLQPLASELRMQAIHHDITDDNAVATPNASRRLMPDGVIDFGDVLYGWLVADLAVTCAALLHHADSDPFFILPAVKAFHARYPLNQAELKALWPLIVARAGVLVASSEQQLSIDPDNDYVLGNIDHERMIFEVATSVPYPLMEAAILEAAGALPKAPDVTVSHTLLPSLNAADFRLTDLTVTSPDLPRDSWADQEIDWKLLARAAMETGIASTRYGEHRLSYTKPLSQTPPATFALHIDVCLPGGTEAFAPFDATIMLDGHHLILSTPDLCLHLDGIDCGLEDGASVKAGDAIGAVAGTAGGVGGLRIQLCRDPDLVPPLFAKPQQSAIWRRICPSPSRLLGVGIDAPAPESESLLERRHKSFAKPQKNYYAEPPQIERGWKEHLFDVKGRAYLDMVNNVTILG